MTHQACHLSQQSLQQVHPKGDMRKCEVFMTSKAYTWVAKSVAGSAGADLNTSGAGAT